MDTRTENLAELVGRARHEAEQAGELRPRPGPVSWDLPGPIREAIWTDLASGEYDRAARGATGDDPEMVQQ